MSSTWTLRSMTRPISETFLDWVARVIAAIILLLFFFLAIVAATSPYFPCRPESVADKGSALWSQFVEPALHRLHCVHFIKSGIEVIEEFVTKIPAKGHPIKGH